jgi:ABC-type lipoprotein export system ATPase subunit
VKRRAQLRLRRIGFVFQRFYLLPMLTAFENVELPMIESGIPRRERVSSAKSPRARGPFTPTRHRPISCLAEKCNALRLRAFQPARPHRR